MINSSGFRRRTAFRKLKDICVFPFHLALRRKRMSSLPVSSDAVDAAQEAGEAGRPAQVLTHGIDGTDAVRWSYGDPYPYPYRLHG